MWAHNGLLEIPPVTPFTGRTKALIGGSLTPHLDHQVRGQGAIWALIKKQGHAFRFPAFALLESAAQRANSCEYITVLKETQNIQSPCELVGHALLHMRADTSRSHLNPRQIKKPNHFPTTPLGTLIFLKTGQRIRLLNNRKMRSAVNE